jgi:AcrR family transcriptional regulator
MVLAAARLFRTQGVTGTGLREIVEEADAPRGSLQHYFPGGKEQLITEAVELSGAFAGRRIQHLMGEIDPATPGALFAAFAGEWRDLYLRVGFAQGCPLAAATVDNAATSGELRGALASAFSRWQAALEVALTQLGVAPSRVSRLATLMMTSIEGVLILARSCEDATTINVVVEELRPVLDGAVVRRRAPRRRH